MPIRNVEILRELGVEADISHVVELGLSGKLDVEVIPYCRQHGFVLVTEDRNIRRNPLEVAALKSAGIGFVEVRISKQANLLQRHQVYVNGIEKLVKAVRQQPPFCLVLTRDGIREDGLNSALRKGRRKG